MITITQASKSDTDTIEDILYDVVDWLDSTKKSMWNKEKVAWKELSRYYSATDFYIASLDGEAVGCMALIDYDPLFWEDIPRGNSLFIHKLAVKRSAASKGISNALIAFAKNKCKCKNIKAVRLDCHQNREKLRKFYESENFVCVAEKCLWGKYQTALYVWYCQ